MKNLTNQIIAFFLLLCFVVTIVPLNFIHEHSHSHTEEIYCDINDNVHSEDACHFSLYHNQLEEEHCKHKAHISENEIECEFCKMLTSKREIDSSLKEETKHAKHNFSLLLALKFAHHKQSFTDLYYNKGPPSTI